VTTLGARARGKLDKKERIRQAARELFLERGYEATTTKEVAERAGVATGTLFLYARDKPDLLCLVMHERLAATVDRALSTLPKAAPLLDRLMHLFRVIFEMYGEMPALAADFVKVVPGADGPNGQQVNAQTFAFLRHLMILVAEAKERGEVAADIDALRAARNIFALYFAALMSWLARLETLEAALDPGLRESLALQIRGMRG
jgi:TetR/AcrR family transcriptional regulator, cholesterol catabolism regulator